MIVEEEVSSGRFELSVFGELAEQLTKKKIITDRIPEMIRLSFCMMKSPLKDFLIY